MFNIVIVIIIIYIVIADSQRPSEMIFLYICKYGTSNNKISYLKTIIHWEAQHMDSNCKPSTHDAIIPT